MEESTRLVVADLWMVHTDREFGVRQKIFVACCQAGRHA